jgi:hypothetical protein
MLINLTHMLAFGDRKFDSDDVEGQDRTGATCRDEQKVLLTELSSSSVTPKQL